MYSGKRDPAEFATALRHEKESILKPPLPCPFPAFPEHNADLFVADWCKCSVPDARVLGETELDVYNEYLFLSTAKAEAEPKRQEFEAQERETEKNHKDSTHENHVARRSARI